MLNLDIAQCSVAVYAPVGDAGAFINQALFEQGAEHLANSLRAALVHREALTLPVAGNAQMLQLINDAVAILLLPFPNAFQELFTAQVIASLALFFFDNLFNLNLGCQACMVIAGHPQGVVAHHAVPADQDILQGVIQRMPHMQLTGDVRWGDNNTEGVLAFFYLSMKITMLFPEFIPFLLYGSRVINLRNIMFFAHINFLLKLKKPCPLRTGRIIVVPPIFLVLLHKALKICNVYQTALPTFIFSKAAPGLHHFHRHTACTNRCFSFVALRKKDFRSSPLDILLYSIS